MEIRIQVAILCTLFLAAPTILKADELKPESPAAPAAVRDAMRLEAAAQEFAERIDQYEAGKVPVNVVLQSNSRWLQASLIAGPPNAAVDYDHRARSIESLARRKLELGAGSRPELAQAKEARLDVILRNLLGHSTPSK